MTAAAAEGAALIAAAVWGASDFCGGLVTRRSTPATVLMIAHGLSLVLLLAGDFLFHSAMPAQRTVIYGLIAGLAGGIGLLALYRALSFGAMGLVAALSGLITAAVPVAVSFFTEARPSWLQLSGFAIAGGAIWLIAYTPGDDAKSEGLGLAVLAGICFGILLVCLHLGGKGNVLWTMTFSRVGSFSCAVALALAGKLRRGAVSAETKTPRNWKIVFPLAAGAGLLDTTGNLLYTYSSLAGRLDVAAVLSSLYPAGTILLAIWLLRERATRGQTAGMGLALIAVAMISA